MSMIKLKETENFSPMLMTFNILAVYCMKFLVNGTEQSRFIKRDSN